jgi:hypothetical protein
VQDALRNGDNSKTGMQHLFAPDRSDKAATGHHSTKNNVQGMLLYHPILLESSCQAPDDLNKQIIKLLQTNKPTLVARSRATYLYTNYDKNNAIKQLELELLATSIKTNFTKNLCYSIPFIHFTIRVTCLRISKVRAPSMCSTYELTKVKHEVPLQRR